MLIAILAEAGLGGVEVTVVGFAETRGPAGAAGVLLAVFAASSVVGGMAYGARTSTSAPASRLLLLTAACALALLPLALASSVLTLGCLLILAGSPFTAQWTAASLVLDTVTPAASAAEAYNWLSTANGAGVALGGLIAGAANELSGIRAAFVASAALVALAAATAFLRRRNLCAMAPASLRARSADALGTSSPDQRPPTQALCRRATGARWLE